MSDSPQTPSTNEPPELKALILERGRALGGIEIEINYDGEGDEGQIGETRLYSQVAPEDPNADRAEINLCVGEQAVTHRVMGARSSNSQRPQTRQTNLGVGSQVSDKIHTNRFYR
jgi:hypothetical protein